MQKRWYGTSLLRYGLGCVQALLAAAAMAAGTGDGRPSVEGGSPVTGAIKDAGGVLVLMQTGRLRLEAWDDGIIRVQYTPKSVLPGPATSAVLPANRGTVNWSCDLGDPQTVTLTTPKLRAVVERASGAVRFLDADGKILLQEPEGGGKSMRPVTVDGLPFWKTTQSFLSPGDESLYGLGGFWHGFLDHKGDMVKFQQFNTCDVSPVLVSSNGYAVLWDNAALGEFRGCREPVTIPAEQFFQPDGSGPGLKAEYFADYNLGKVVHTTVAPVIDFSWGAGKEPAPMIKKGRFSARWTGKLRIPQEGDFFFHLRSATMRGRVVIDRKLVIENWIEHGDSFDTARVHLAAGDHEFQAEFAGFADQGSAMQLKWIPPGEPADRYSWVANASEAIDYYVIRSPTIDAALAGYRRLTGSAPLFPRSAYAFWHSQASCMEKPSIPNSQKNMLFLANEYRRRQIPCDNIVQDFQYWSKMGQHDFRSDTHPDPVAMMKELKNLHYQVMFAIWCIFDAGKPNHDEMLNKGFILNPGNGKEWYDPFNPPPGAQEWYNPWNLQARATYWRQLRDGLFDPTRVKADAFWIDSTEGIGPAWKCNEYPLVSTQAVYEGWRGSDPDRRVYILTRSLFPGMQRNASALWSGDIGTDMFTLARQIPNGLGVCMTGLPYWTTDVGGFAGGFGYHKDFSYPRDPDDKRYNETFVRWMQYGAFCPMYRIHSARPRAAPWEFGPASEAIAADFIRLRYRLMPYIYSLAARVTNEGYTMMRALPMDFMADKQVRGITDQFMFGPALMVSPVTVLQATSRNVYLPAGTWYDFWTGKSETGGKIIDAAAPLERLPLFVRAGSIVPLGPVMQYTGEKPLDPLELRVYSGADGCFTLYDDDGISYGYERGQHSEIPLSWDEQAQTLTIGARSGSFPGMSPRVTFRIVWVRDGVGTGLPESATADCTVAYDGAAVVVRKPNVPCEVRAAAPVPVPPVQVSPAAATVNREQMEKTVEAILQQMTLEEKVSMCQGGSQRGTAVIPRLGIQEMLMYNGNRGTNGGGTFFPSGIGQAATFAPERVEAVGRAVAAEAKLKNFPVLLAPAINIQRDPVCGRDFEYFTEDPCLNAQLSAAFVKGVQSLRVIACAKHYAANSQETNRGSVSSEMDERTLREIYLPGFEAAVKAGVWSVMTGANKFRGEHCCENDYLLNQVLKKDLGFSGFVITDWAGAQNTVMAANGGCDLSMPPKANSPFSKEAILKVIRRGEVKEAAIDDKVRRLLRAAYFCGHLKDSPATTPEPVDFKAHQQLALEVAREGMVLLKNEGGLLPLNRGTLKSVAVIGPNADNKLYGGGSSGVQPPYYVTALQGLRDKLKTTDVKITAVPFDISSVWEVISSKYVKTAKGEPGLTARYTGLHTDSKKPGAKIERIDDKIDFNWEMSSPDRFIIDPSAFSCTWTGKLVPPVSGAYVLRISGSGDSIELRLDGRKVMQKYGATKSFSSIDVTINLAAGREYDLFLRYYKKGLDALVKLDWIRPDSGQLLAKVVEQSAQAAKEADVALVFAGIDHSVDTEGMDRENLRIPPYQDALLAAVLKANPKTVVVLNNGTPLEMDPWLKDAPAVLEAWYPGLEHGHAVADLLFGDYNPSGKLPMTFPRRYEDSPAHPSRQSEPRTEKTLFHEGVLVGYRWFDAKAIEPLFPFGHGLSYTTFAYNKLAAEKRGDSLLVSCEISNSGTRAGAEVAQLYVGDPDCSVVRPPRELKAFRKVWLNPGESRRLEMELDARAFSFWDEKTHGWKLEPGTFVLELGSSSRDIRQKITVSR